MVEVTGGGEPPPPELIAPGLAAGLLASGTDCFRMFSAPEGWADYWGGRVLLSSAQEEVARSWMEFLLGSPRSGAFRAAAPIRSVYFRKLVRCPSEGDAPALWHGGPDGDFCVRENGLCYGVNLAGGYSPGLFPDQRDNRSRLAGWLRGRIARCGEACVLNCFAYTCAFSVAAASAGAQTCSVDLSKKFLERGKSNFALNGLPAGDHRFVAEDVLRFFPRLLRRGEKFDAILIDPPTFSRGARGKVFRVERELPRLLEMAVACARPDATVLLSTNCSRLSAADLAGIASAFVPRRNIVPGEVPEDFRGGNCPATLWLEVG